MNLKNRNGTGLRGCDMRRVLSPKILLSLVLLLLFSGVADAQINNGLFNSSLDNWTYSNGWVWTPDYASYFDGWGTLGSIESDPFVITGNITANMYGYVGFYCACGEIVFGNISIIVNGSIIDSYDFTGNSWDDLCCGGSWKSYISSDLSSYVGQTATFKFSGYTTYGYYIWMGLDNVLMSSIIPSFDPSGYVNDSNGNYLANALVNISNTTFSTSDFTDANGYWNVDIYEDATYTYNVSLKGYSLLNGSQAFTMGGTNYNFTLTPSKGHISGNVYEWTADTPTKQSRPELQSFKVEQNNGNQLYKIYVGSTLTWTGGYVFKVQDIDDGTHMTQIQLLLNGSVVDTGWIDEKDTYIYRLDETTDAVLYLSLYIDEVFTGREAAWIHAKPGYYIRAKGTAEKLIDYLISVAISSIISYTPFAILSPYFYLWDVFGAEKTSDFSQLSGSDAVDEYYRVDFDFGEGDFNTIIAYYDAEKVSGTPKICYYFSDDAMASIPETSYCTQFINIDQDQVYPTQPKNFNDLDADNDNIVTMWLKIPAGYGVHKRFNLYASATCTNCNLKPLPDAIISYSSVPPVKSNSVGAYSLYLPLGNATVNFSKDGYESKNVTHWFNSTYPDFSYDVILNKTSSNATQPQYLLSIQPNPIIVGQAAQAIYQTINEYSSYRITVHHAYQEGATSVFDSDYGVIPNKNGYVDLPNYPIGEYTVYLSGSDGIWDLWKWTPVISTNFTVISSTPSINWQLSEYYMGDIMKLDYYLPSGNQNITTYYPNGSILQQITVSAAVNTSQTLLYITSVNGTPPGKYQAFMTGNTAGSITNLLSISVFNYTLNAPNSVVWGKSFNIKYQSPKPSNLHIYDSDGIELITPKIVSGIGSYAFNTSSLENTAQTITIKLIKDGTDKASINVQIGLSAVDDESGSQRATSLANLLDSNLFWALLFTVGMMAAVAYAAAANKPKEQ